MKKRQRLLTDKQWKLIELQAQGEAARISEATAGAQSSLPEAYLGFCKPGRRGGSCPTSFLRPRRAGGDCSSAGRSKASG